MRFKTLRAPFVNFKVPRFSGGVETIIEEKNPRNVGAQSKVAQQIGNGIAPVAAQKSLGGARCRPQNRFASRQCRLDLHARKRARQITRFERIAGGRRIEAEIFHNVERSEGPLNWQNL